MDENCSVAGEGFSWDSERWVTDGFALGDNMKSEEENGLCGWVEEPVLERTSATAEERSEFDETAQSGVLSGEVTRRAERDRSKRTTSAGVTSSSGYPGVSWNRRMGAWLAFFYDAESRRSRTFHPKYYDFDVETARLAAIEFMKTVENRERPKRSARSVDTSTLGPRKRSTPPQKSKGRGSQSIVHDQVSDLVETGAASEAPPTESSVAALSECYTKSHSNASDSLYSVSSQAFGEKSSGSTLASTEPGDWQLEPCSTDNCEMWSPHYAVKCEPQQADGIGEETCADKNLEGLDEPFSCIRDLLPLGALPQIEATHQDLVGGNCRLCAAGDAEYDEQLESTDDAAGDFTTETTSRHSHTDFEYPQLPDVQGEVLRDQAVESESRSGARQETGVEDTGPDSPTYAPSTNQLAIVRPEGRAEKEPEVKEESCCDGDPGSRGSTGLSGSESDVMSDLMPCAETEASCGNEDQKKMAENLFRSYSTDSVSYPNHTPEFFPLQSMTLAELSGDLGAEAQPDMALHDTGSDAAVPEGTGHEQLPAWLGADIASSGNAVASAAGNLHRAVLDRRGSWRGLARLRSQDSISAFMGGRADLMFSSLEGLRPISGGLSRSGSMMCIQDPMISPLIMNLKTEYRDDGPLRKVPSGPFGKLGSDGFPEYLSTRGGASPIADSRKSGNFKSVSPCLASDSPALENVMWDSNGEPQHYTRCSACP